MNNAMFWRSTAERTLATFAATLISVLGVGTVDVLHINWIAALSVSGGAALITFLKCIITGATTDGNPSIGSSEVLSTPGKTADPIGEDKVVVDPAADSATDHTGTHTGDSAPVIGNVPSDTVSDTVTDPAVIPQRAQDDIPTAGIPVADVPAADIPAVVGDVDPGPSPDLPEPDGTPVTNSSEYKGADIQPDAPTGSSAAPTPTI